MSEEQFTTETMADYEGQFDNADPWHIVSKYMEQQTDLPVKIEGIVNGGAIAYIEGLRGFIPASKLSLSYIEDLETYLLKEIKVRVIDIDPAENRLVLSAREILKEEQAAERAKKVQEIPVGSVLSGTVDSLQSYGAFILLENGLSGLVHVSQICEKRIKSPADVLKTGEEVQVKVIGIKDGKISMDVKQIIMLGALLIALSFLYSTLIALVSVFAKSMKEASSYIMPMYMLILVIGLSTMFSFGNTPESSYWIPVYNSSVVLKEILTQEVTILHYVITLLMTFGMGAILTGVIVKAFESEKVMAS